MRTQAMWHIMFLMGVLFVAGCSCSKDDGRITPANERGSAGAGSDRSSRELVSHKTTSEQAIRNDTDLLVKRLIITDDKGQARITLSAPSGSPAIAVMDEDGEIRVLLGLHKDKPGLFVYDESGRTRLEANLENNNARFKLCDETGGNGVVLGANDSGPLLGLIENGRPVVTQP